MCVNYGDCLGKRVDRSVEVRYFVGKPAKREVRQMRVDMTFDQQKVEQQGYTLAAVRQTVQKNFAAHGLHCVQNGPVLSCAELWQRG